MFQTTKQFGILWDFCGESGHESHAPWCIHGAKPTKQNLLETQLGKRHSRYDIMELYWWLMMVNE